MNRLHPPNSIPAPSISGGSWLLGNSTQFQNDPLGFMTRTAPQYGDIAQFRLGNVQCYAINHPEAVQRILQDNHHNYVKGNFFKTLRLAVGDGLLTSEGDIWLRQRRLMSPIFHRQRISGFSEIMVEQIKDMLSDWESRSNTGQIFDLAEDLTHLTMRIVTQALFGAQVNFYGNTVSQAIANMLDDLQYRFIIPFYPGLWLPTRRNLSAKRNLQIIDDTVYGIIRDRRRKGIEGDDLLGLLMSARDQDTGLPMSDRQLRDEVITIFVAGHETTASGLSWLFYLLDQNPDQAEAASREARSVLEGRLPDFNDLAGLSSTRRIFDETLRLYPPAWITNRTALRKDELCGVNIPGGAVVVISPYAIHRLLEFWPDPLAFKPDRFSAEQSAGRARFAYIPFGGGPHQCIGNQFALVEAVLIAAAILQRYRVRLAPGESVVPLPVITLRPKNGIKVTIEKIN